jgi:hypothetical protein
MLLALPMASSAWAQDASSTPSPKELWNAYPLAPEDAPATATPSEAATEGAATPTPRQAGAAPPAAAKDDGGSAGWVIGVIVAALLAFGLGLAIGRRRRRERLEAAEAVGDSPPVEPPAPKRFQWRDYPEPARPAPPPPPPPNGVTTFKAALKEQRAAASKRAKQEEPH